jgi:hypothetical protein
MLEICPSWPRLSRSHREGRANLTGALLSNDNSRIPRQA